MNTLSEGCCYFSWRPKWNVNLILLACVYSGGFESHLLL